MVELDRDGVRAEPHHVGTWRFARPEPVELDGADDLDALADRLTDFDAKERTALRLELRGALDLRGAARLEAMLDRARDLFAGLDVRDGELRVAARDGESRRPRARGLRGARGRAARRGGARRDPDAGAARDALALLVRLAGAPEAARVKDPAPAPAQLPRHRASARSSSRRAA